MQTVKASRKMTSKPSFGSVKPQNKDFAAAQFILGVMYLNTADGVSTRHYTGILWFRKAADQGLALAQSDLGDMYVEGRGVPRDDKQAVAWYRKAANQNYAPAQFYLGYMYLSGQGVPEDDQQTIDWFRKAADQGSRRRNCISAFCTRTVRAFRKTISKPSLGSAKPPYKLCGGAD